jgi:hypothetical protein
MPQISARQGAGDEEAGDPDGASVTSSSAGTEAMLPLNPLVIKGLNACLIDKRLSGGDASQASRAAGRRVYPTIRARHSPKPIGT